MNNLAGFYYHQDKKDEALKAFKKGDELSSKILGENHPTTQQFKGNYLHVKKELEESSSAN